MRRQSRQTASQVIGLMALVVCRAGIAVEVRPPLETPITQSMSRPIHAEWRAVPLTRVVLDLSRAAQVPFLIDEPALSDEGVDPNQLVTLQLGDTTVGQALHFLMEETSITWDERHHGVRIITKSGAKESLTTRIYEIGDLIQTLDALDWKGFAGGASRPTVFGVGMVEDAADWRRNGVPVWRPATSVETSFADCVTTHSGGAWRNTGVGSGGTLYVGTRRWIVRQCQRTHDEIGGLLNAVEQLASGRSKARFVDVRRPGYPAAAEEALLARLSRPSDVPISAASLPEFAQKLHQTHEVPVWIHRSSLAQDGIALGQLRVSLPGRGRPLLEELAESLESQSLEMVIENGYVVIATQPMAAECVFTRVYRVDDIPEAADPQRFAEIVMVVGTGYDWGMIDGVAGTLQQLTRGLLVVRTSYREQRQIMELLERLRDPERAAAADAAATAAELRCYPVLDERLLTDIETLLPELLGGKEAWPEGSLRRFGPNLLIRQPPTMQHDVEAFFESVRRVGGKRFTLTGGRPSDNAARQTPP